MARRQTAGYDLKPTAQAIIDRVSARRGMKKSVLVQRVMEFFARQPEPVQTAMLDAVDAGFEHQYAAALEALAAELRGRAKPANGAKVPDEGLVIVHPPEQALPQRRRPRGREQS